MRGLKHFTDGKRGHTGQPWERSEASVVTIGVGLNMASKRYSNVLFVWAKQNSQHLNRLGQCSNFARLMVYMKEGRTPSFSFPRANGPEKR